MDDQLPPIPPPSTDSSQPTIKPAGKHKKWTDEQKAAHSAKVKATNAKKKAESLKSGVAKPSGPVSQKKSELSPWQKAEQEAQQKEEQFQEDLKEILKESEQYKDFPELKLTRMMMHPKSVDALYAAIARKVHQGDTKMLIRVLDQLVGKPMQQVQLTNNAASDNLKTIVGQLTKEQMVQIGLGLTNQNQLPTPVGTTNDGTNIPEPVIPTFDPSNPEIPEHGTMLMSESETQEVTENADPETKQSPLTIKPYLPPHLQHLNQKKEEPK